MSHQAWLMKPGTKPTQDNTVTAVNTTTYNDSVMNCIAVHNDKINTETYMIVHNMSFYHTESCAGI